MLCRVEMPKNEQIFGRFFRYRMLHGRGAGQLALPIVLAVLALFLFIGSPSPLFPTALLVVAAVYLVYLLYLRPGIHFRAQPGAALITEVTIFTGSGLTHTQRSEEGGPPETRSLSYDTLVRAVETRQDFYLFTDAARAILIDKDYFTKGGPEELREALRAAMKDRFVAKP